MSCCLSCFIVPATWNSDAATATDMVRRSSLPAACTRCRMFVAVMMAVASWRPRKVCCPQCRSTRGGGGGVVVVVGLAGFIIYCCWIYLGQTLLGTHGQGWALSVLGADRRDDPGTHTVVTVL